MSVGLDSYKYDCSRTGFYVENCSTPTFSNENKVTAEATASTVYSMLTHFKGF